MFYDDFTVRRLHIGMFDLKMKITRTYLMLSCYFLFYKMRDIPNQEIRYVVIEFM